MTRKNQDKEKAQQRSRPKIKRSGKDVAFSFLAMPKTHVGLELCWTQSS
jgi:hypothetical protein